MPVTKQEVPRPTVDAAVGAAVGKRALELAKSGKHPKTIFFLRALGTNSLVLLNTPEPTLKAVLLFSSAFTARFYMQEKKLPTEIAGVSFDQFSSVAEDLHASGVLSFVMDLSPNSPASNVMSPTTKRITTEQVTFAWAVGRTVRNFHAQRTLRPLLTNKNFGTPEIQKELRRALESIRACGGYDVPYVHWMMALIAGMQHDEPGRLQATADLETFGPDFVGRTPPLESREYLQEWGKSWTNAQIGLMTEFEMLNGPDGKPSESSLRFVNVERKEP